MFDWVLNTTLPKFTQITRVSVTLYFRGMCKYKHALKDCIHKFKKIQSKQKIINIGLL